MKPAPFHGGWDGIFGEGEGGEIVVLEGAFVDIDHLVEVGGCTGRYNKIRGCHCFFKTEEGVKSGILKFDTRKELWIKGLLLLFMNHWT